MKKIILALSIAVLFVCIFAITVSAAGQSYASFEVVKNDNTRVTVYTVGVKDVGNGQIYLNETIYTEAPLDSEGTYATLAWSQVKEIDFTVTGMYVYTAKTDSYAEYTGGTNNNVNKGCVTVLKGWSNAATFNTVKKVNTGNAYGFGTGLFKGWTGIETVIFGYPAKTISDDMFMNSSVANIIFDENCQITRCYNNPFNNCDNIVSVDFPDSFTYLGNSGLFSGCDNLERVGWPANCPEIPGGAFSNCAKLVFEIPNYITNIKGTAFTGCSMTTVTIPATVTEIGYNAFTKCKNLTTVIFEDGCSVSKIYAHTFDGCDLREIKLPNTVTQLKQNVFANNNNLKVINLGASFTDFNLEGNNAASLNCGNALEKLYLSKNFTAAAVRGGIFGSDVYANDYKNRLTSLVVYYEGDKAAADAIVAAALGDGTVVNGVFAFMTVVSLEEYEALEAAGELSGRYMIHSYNKCDAFYDGVHAEGKVINSCQFGCGRNCGMAQLLENPQHNLSLVVNFGENGYFSASCATESCSVCKTVTMKEDIGAMFVDYGYSATETPINGAYSMSQFYGINRAAIEQYKTVVNADFAFGFVVAANADPFGAVANGTLSEDKIFVTEEKFFAYDYISVKVSGISDANKDKAVAFCVFVNDGEELYYLDGGKTVDTVNVKSYNSIVNK